MSLIPKDEHSSWDKLLDSKTIEELNTIEEKIIQLHNTKRNLAESLLEGSDQSAKMSLNELVDLIKENG